MTGLSHLDPHGRASMVDVSGKDATKRAATATGELLIGLDPHFDMGER